MRAMRGHLTECVVALSLALGVVACGGSDDDGQSVDEQRIRVAVEQTRKALVQGDEDAFCASLSRSARQLHAGSGDQADTCERHFAALFESGRIAETSSHEVGSVRVDGDRATVVALPKGTAKPERAAFVRERGTWKVRSWFSSSAPASDASGGSPPRPAPLDDRTQIRAVYAMFLEAVENRRPKAACTTVASVAMRSFAGAGTTCGRLLAEAIRAGRLDGVEWPGARLARLTVDGVRAVGVVESPGEDDRPITFLEEEGEWRVGSAFGIGP